MDACSAFSLRPPCASLTVHGYALTCNAALIINITPAPRFRPQDPELLRFIDIECFIWSTVPADLTPMINAGMVFCDRHFGGINYPVGGVGRIGEELAAGACVRVCVCGGGMARRALGTTLSDGQKAGKACTRITVRT